MEEEEKLWLESSAASAVPLGAFASLLFKIKKYNSQKRYFPLPQLTGFTPPPPTTTASFNGAGKAVGTGGLNDSWSFTVNRQETPFGRVLRITYVFSLQNDISGGVPPYSVYGIWSDGVTSPQIGPGVLTLQRQFSGGSTGILGQGGFKFPVGLTLNVTVGDGTINDYIQFTIQVS